MASSWRSGCPVPIEDLRLLSLSYIGFDGGFHTGEMVVHHDVAEHVVEVFGKLFEAKFPIRRMRLVDDYGGEDDRSMEADNTSAFNCRPVTGGTSWSEHAYGRAIDINPVQNPYVTDAGRIEPSAGASYVDRSVRAKGMIHAGDAVVDAFAFVGWGWGGAWSNPTDYQHFSSSDR
jgi:poly-gamma-glutamate synthesis protein (capsule biosynthesis protein)